MKLLLDILQGLGLASASGLRPFLPGLLAGGLALGDLGIDFEGTPFAFLEAPWWLALLAVLLVVSFLLTRALPAERVDTGVAAVGIVLGALLCAGSIADRHEQWWYGPIVGALVAILAALVARRLVARVRARFTAAGDSGAAATLPVYAEVAGLVVAGLSVLFPPLSVVAIGLLVWLLIAGRKREQQKYAGLRILR